MGPLRQVAIYSPASSVYFEPHRGQAQGGGAEVQMAFLASALAARGLRTALIVGPMSGPSPSSNGPDLIERPAHAGAGRLGALAEARHIWRAMADADAAAYVFRGSSSRLIVGAAFCRSRRRRLVFSAANDLDFDFERADRSSLNLRLYRAALSDAQLVVVQRQQQLELARAAGFRSLELIPSFAEPAEPADQRPEAFLWIGRLVDYKRPLAFVRLAESLPEIRFRMASWSTDETAPQLAEAVRLAGERLPNLELVVRMPRAKLQELIARTAAVVSTSEAEGMPNVFLEAWARGVPVISLDYDPDGKIEALGLGVVAGGSEQGLRAATASLWRDEPRRSALGARAREYVRASHSAEAIGARWAEVMGGLVRTGGTPG